MALGGLLFGFDMAVVSGVPRFIESAVLPICRNGRLVLYPLHWWEIVSLGLPFPVAN